MKSLVLCKLNIPRKLFPVFFGSNRTGIMLSALAGIDFGVNLILIYWHSDVHTYFPGELALRFVNTVFFAGLSLCWEPGTVTDSASGPVSLECGVQQGREHVLGNRHVGSHSMSGAASVTGTLTQNEMVFKRLHLGTVAYGLDSMDEVQSHIFSIYTQVELNCIT